MHESVLTRRVISGLKKEYGGSWHKIHGSPYQRAGLPDIIGCLKGQFFGIEVKMPGNRPTDLQRATLEKLASDGAVCGIVHSLSEAQSLVGTGSPGVVRW